jgi:hypothetical protein
MKVFFFQKKKQKAVVLLRRRFDVSVEGWYNNSVVL